jgi:hypothetical protein
MGYEALIPPLAFLAALQLATRTKVHPAYPASIAVLLPYAITLTLKYVTTIAYGLPVFETLFSIASVATVIIQFVLAVYLFKKIRDFENLMPTILWGIGGFFVIMMGVPYLVSFIPFI